MPLPPPYEPTGALRERLDTIDRRRQISQRIATATPDAINNFLSQCTTDTPIGNEQASVLYRAFIDYITVGGWPRRFLPSQIEFSAIMAVRYPKRRTQVGVFYFGLALLSEPLAPFVFEQENNQ